MGESILMDDSSDGGAVVRRVFRDQQHVPCKQDEYDEYGAEETKMRINVS